MERTENEGPAVTNLKTPVAFVAVLPGPRNGMTLMTKVISDEMAERCDTRFFDIGKVYRRPGKSWVIRKALRSVFSAIRIAFWKPRSEERLYLVLNATGGLLYNLLQAVSGRIRGFPMVVHHHVWSYLSKPSWVMRLLLVALGNDAVHVVACPEMAKELEAAYGKSLRFAFLTPGIVAIPEFKSKKVESDDGRFVIGMLSNLTIEKGVGEAIDTFETLRKADRDVRLVLGGPIASPDAGKRIEEAIKTHGDCVQHRGPIYGDDKEAFFRELDAFIFPTQYANESWGIVLNEALMAGVPAITYQRGCTGYLVGNSGGLVVQQDDDFSIKASHLIEQWIDDPQKHGLAQTSALHRGRELRKQAQDQLKLFVDGFQTDQWPMPDGRCSI